ncbi:MAG: hypothetical protein ACI97B_002353 [Verrucomicrobiales bacterium]|jgi:hypothetical protein
MRGRYLSMGAEDTGTDNAKRLVPRRKDFIYPTLG